MSASYKLEKYANKLSTVNDPEKKAIYENKIAYYSQLIGGSLQTFMKPRVTDLSTYKLADYIDDPVKIKAIGYGLTAVRHKHQPLEFERRAMLDTDVLIQIWYCGVCLSDWHCIKGEWDCDFPCIFGHEITGKVLRVGKSVTKFKPGDIVGLPAYINSCLECDTCKAGLEQYCENQTSSIYDDRDRYPHEIKKELERTYGGFSNIITVYEEFVYKIPNGMNMAKTAPLMDAGLTTFSPMKKYIEPGMRVGIRGIGGLGHVAVKIAKAMGCFVLALTSTKWKLADSIKNLGADDSTLIMDHKKMKSYENSLDFILNCSPVIDDVSTYLELLKLGGTFCNVGYFNEFKFDASMLIPDKFITMSVVGSRSDVKDMLEFCHDHKIVCDIEEIPIQDIDKTYERLVEKSAKYRFVVNVIDTIGKL